MAYKLSFWEIIKAYFVPLHPLFLSIMLIPVAVLLLYALTKVIKKASFGEILSIIAVVGIVLIAMLAISLPYTGSGWRLEDETLLIKATRGAPESLELKKTRIALVDSAGPWQATRRENGIGLPGFSAGWFRFKNGKKALYFRHGESPYRMVLESGGRYYVLLHPGVKELYWELIARGAQPAEL
nr:hypothetical protein [Clostridia bacterium]